MAARARRAATGAAREGAVPARNQPRSKRPSNRLRVVLHFAGFRAAKPANELAVQGDGRGTGEHEKPVSGRAPLLARGGPTGHPARRRGACWCASGSECRRLQTPARALAGNLARAAVDGPTGDADRRCRAVRGARPNTELGVASHRPEGTRPADPAPEARGRARVCRRRDPPLGEATRDRDRGESAGAGGDAAIGREESTSVDLTQATRLLSARRREELERLVHRAVRRVRAGKPDDKTIELLRRAREIVQTAADN